MSKPAFGDEHLCRGVGAAGNPTNKNSRSDRNCKMCSGSLPVPLLASSAQCLPIQVKKSDLPYRPLLGIVLEAETLHPNICRQSYPASKWLKYICRQRKLQQYLGPVHYLRLCNPHIPVKRGSDLQN